MRLVIQMSEQDVREILAKYFNTELEDVKIMHMSKYVGEGLQMELKHYIDVTVRTKLEDIDLRCT